MRKQRTAEPSIQKKQKYTASHFTKPEKEARPRRERKPIRIALNTNGVRGFMQFTLVACFLVLAIFAGVAVSKVQDAKGEVLGVATEAYDHLLSARDQAFTLQFTDAQESFLAAERAFAEAMDRMPVSEGTLKILAALPTGDTVKNAYHILLAGQRLSRAGAAVSAILAPVASDGIRFEEEGFPTITISEQLVAPEWIAVQDDVTEGLSHLASIHPDALPENFREDFTALAEQLPLLNDTVQSIDDAQALLQYFLGFEGRKEFVVWFQNTTELRATGGFLGSFVVLAADEGKLSVIDVPGKGPYSLNDYLTKKLVPPSPLQLINKHWQVQDANWWPDFPTSAEKFNEFYVDARGFPIDGILAITPEVITSLLDFTGPLALDGYDVKVDPENFVSITQEKASNDFDITVNQPKQFIADLIPVLFTKVLSLSADTIPGVAGTFSSALASRDLQLYSRDASVQERIQSAGWSGEVLAAPQDALMVVATNIGGGKTDDVMTMELDLSTRMTEGAEIEHTLTVQRTHAGDPADPQKGIKNMAYMRFYVPEGSTLVSAENFTAIDRDLVQHPDEDAIIDPFLTTVSGSVVIDEQSGTRLSHEFGRVVFGNWIGTEAGETETATVVYRTPFIFADSLPYAYSLFMQLQAGAHNTTLRHTLTIPESLDFAWTSKDSEPISMGAGSIQYSKVLTTDHFFGAAIE